MFRYANSRIGIQKGIDKIGRLEEKSPSSGSNNDSSSDGSEEDVKNNRGIITTTSSSPSRKKLYFSNKSTDDSCNLQSTYKHDTIQLGHHQPGPGPGYTPTSHIETKRNQQRSSVPTFLGGSIFIPPPPPPSISNKESSPPPYDQALLQQQQQQNVNTHQMQGLLSSTRNGNNAINGLGNNAINGLGNIATNGLGDGAFNGMLQKQVQAASDVVQTLSQLTSTLPSDNSQQQQSTKLPYHVVPSPSPPPPPSLTQSQATKITMPQGEYHIASFTKPIPTSSYITSLSSTDITSPQFQLPQHPMSVPTNAPSPPLPLSSFPSISSSSNTSSSTTSLTDQSTSFTNTFLRGILTSIDSKDPVVANAWLETLLDAIDLLPADVIRREIVVIAVKKGHLSQTSSARKSSCRLLGKIATKLDQQVVRQEVLPTALSLCQDVDAEVRYCMCRHLSFLSCGIGLDATKTTVLPQLVELCTDDNSDVRLAAIETVVQLLGLLDDNTCTRVIVPLVIKSCDQAKQLEDETLVKISHYLGRLCHGLTTNLNSEQKQWFIELYQYLSKLGLCGEQDQPSDGLESNVSDKKLEEHQNNYRPTDNYTTINTTASPTNESNQQLGRPTNTSASPMPDLVPMLESSITNLKTEIYKRCRYECAYNFPAMVLFVGAKTFIEVMYPTFASLSCDSSPIVRCTIASSLHELAKMLGTNFDVTKSQIVSLFGDTSIEVLESMVANMVHIIDALARSGTVLQYGQGGQYSADLSSALVRTTIYQIHLSPKKVYIYIYIYKLLFQ